MLENNRCPFWWKMTVYEVLEDSCWKITVFSCWKITVFRCWKINGFLCWKITGVPIGMPMSSDVQHSGSGLGGLQPVSMDL